MNIKNILFDLGGVLLNLDVSKTEVGFRCLVGDNKKHQEIYAQLNDKQVFEDIETNAISAEEFVKVLQEANPTPVTTAQVETAWSAMLLDFPAQRIELLRELKAAGYTIFLLSNTNSIHLRDFRAIMQAQLGIDDFDAFFDKAYYSHLIELRKPHAEAFQYVLDDANINASETVFIDDNAINLTGARAVGMHTIHHKANSDINKMLKDYLMLD